MAATGKALLLSFAIGIAAPVAAQDVFVNRVRLDDKTRDALERAYGVRIPPARYWYNRVSGVWGAVFVDGKVIMTPN